jgi:tripartite motif-containing protein 37
MAATLNLMRDGSRGSNGSYASSSSSNSSSSSRDGGGSQLPPCAASLVHGSSCSNNHNHSTRNNNNKAHAQRLLLVGGPQQQQQRHQYPFASITTATTTTTSASSQHLAKPQTEQLSSSVDSEDPVSSFENPAGLQIDVQSEMGSLQESDGDDDEEEVEEEDDEPDESSNHHRVPNFARQHHGAMMEHGRTDHVHEASSTLADIFRCFICLGKVVDAQLCPCCSKLVCQPCIKRWLMDQKSECPHCRAPLLVSQLVSCRFISEISLEVEKIQGKLGDNPLEKYCSTHDSPLLYFCTTCSVAVCSDCAILIEDHRNHTFEKLSVAYGRRRKKIRGEAAGLRRRRKELSVLIASVDKNIENVLKVKAQILLFSVPFLNCLKFMSKLWFVSV